jgi:hypothetical protein
MAQSNQATIKACREELVSTPLPQWIEYIGSNKARFNVMDADSVQSFLNQLVKEYGKVDLKLSKDLIASQHD